MVAYASGIRSQDVKRVVEENVPGVSVEDVKDLTQDAITDGADTGLVLEAKDGRIRFRGTMREMSAQLLEQHREELAEALLGRDV